MSRRAILLLTAFGLLTADILFLGWHWPRDTAPNAEVTWIGLDSTSMIVDADAPPLSLRAGRWYLGERPLPDVEAYATRLAAEGHMPVISAPEYRTLVPALRALRARRVCNILIREGGRAIKAAPTPGVPDWDALDIPAFVLCGNPTGDSGFHDTLPPDGPIHVTSAISLR